MIIISVANTDKQHGLVYIMGLAGYLQSNGSCKEQLIMQPYHSTGKNQRFTRKQKTWERNNCDYFTIWIRKPDENGYLEEKRHLNFFKFEGWILY